MHEYPPPHPDVRFLNRWNEELKVIHEGKSVNDSWIGGGGFILSPKGFDIVDQRSTLKPSEEERILTYIQIFNTYASFPSVIDICSKFFKGDERRACKMITMLLEQAKIRFVE